MSKNFINILTFLSFLFVRLYINWPKRNFMINFSLHARFSLSNHKDIGANENPEPLLVNYILQLHKKAKKRK